MPDDKDRCTDPLESAAAPADVAPACRPACPVCGGRLMEIRAKLQCSQCRTIIETCCEGGPES